MNVVGLGESLVRLSAPGHERLEQAHRLELHVGGAEMNALIAAAALGLRATWLTRLADNPLGRRIAAHARAHGVECLVDWDPTARAPLYFVEHGTELRPSEVLYDRSATAMTALTPDCFEWDGLVAETSAVLCSGITCALGPGPARSVVALFDAARGAGARTVFDVNHRSRLWSWEEAVPVLRDVVARVDVLLASEHDLARLLEAESDLARRTIAELGPDVVVLRESADVGGGRVGVCVTAVTADAVETSPRYEAGVVDAFGAGDAALAAFLAAVLAGAELGHAVDRAAWACAFQHTIPGDACLLRPDDLEARRDDPRRILR
jgi:2-dehydro-3-deoxygluconokinase